MFGALTILELIAAVSVWLASLGMVYQVEEWRWKAKETNYVQEQLAQTQKEAAKENKAATQFEKKQEATNETYKKIDKALDVQSKPAVVCFGAKRLRVVNSALARKAPDPSGPNDAVPGPDPATGK